MKDIWRALFGFSNPHADSKGAKNLLFETPLVSLPDRFFTKKLRQACFCSDLNRRGATVQLKIVKAIVYVG